MSDENGTAVVEARVNKAALIKAAIEAQPDATNAEVIASVQAQHGVVVTTQDVSQVRARLKPKPRVRKPEPMQAQTSLPTPVVKQVASLFGKAQALAVEAGGKANLAEIVEALPA